MRVIMLVSVVSGLMGCSPNDDELQKARYNEYLRIQQYNKDMCMRSSGTIVLSQWDWSFVECKEEKK